MREKRGSEKCEKKGDAPTRGGRMRAPTQTREAAQAGTLPRLAQRGQPATLQGARHRTARQRPPFASHEDSSPLLPPNAHTEELAFALTRKHVGAPRRGGRARGREKNRGKPRRGVVRAPGRATWHRAVFAHLLTLLPLFSPRSAPRHRDGTREKAHLQVTSRRRQKR